MWTRALNGLQRVDVAECVAQHTTVMEVFVNKLVNALAAWCGGGWSVLHGGRVQATQPHVAVADKLSRDVVGVWG